jgi:DNA-binding SARP family transcriptional activator
VTLSGPAQRLLAALALRGPSRRQDLARLLFGPAERRGRARLRDVLFRMPARGVLLDGARSAELALAGSVRVDVHALTQVLTQVAEGRPRALGQLPWVLDLLPGWDEDWVAEERTRLHDTVVGALLACSARCLREGGRSAGLLVERAAVVAAERALQLAPLDEEAARAVIRAHLAAGDPALALRCLASFTERLQRELRVGPAQDTRALVAGLVAPRGVPVSRGPSHSGCY